MSRRKTEAFIVHFGGWYHLCKTRDEVDDVIESMRRAGKKKRGRIIQLVERDPKAEAVVRAAVQVKAAWNSSTAEWSRAVDVLGEAIDALRASRKAM